MIPEDRTDGTDDSVYRKSRKKYAVDSGQKVPGKEVRKMKELSGRTIHKGIAVGKIHLFSENRQTVKKTYVEDAETEISRFEQAKESALKELERLEQKTRTEAGEEKAAIFQAHGLLLKDEGFSRYVKEMIASQKVSAEYAVAAAEEHYAGIFEHMEDEYFRERSSDIRDVSGQIISILVGETEKKEAIGEEPVLLAAKDLTPSQTVRLERSKLLGFVTETGTASSHTAILARSMDLPALTGIPVNEEMDGRIAILDGIAGKLILDPDEKTVAAYGEKKRAEEKQKELFRQLKGKKDITRDGKRIRLYANIGRVEDTAAVMEYDAAGIGLFRSEFLYLEKDDFPTEEEQFQAYRTVAENMAGKKVIIRTLDIGADKQAPYFGLAKEENPAMGYRAIRICLDREEMFRTQLRAILRAGAYGNISIMYPMIISVSEVKRCKAILEDVKKELIRQGSAVGTVEQGIMIETPAAVMISDLLAEEVEFFSIGTNDLTQYTLAADRQNEKLDAVYDAHHPAILRMIRMVVENGHRKGCWVGICGELGADLTMTEEFLRMGIDEFSVSTSMVLPIRKLIREASVE